MIFAMMLSGFIGSLSQNMLSSALPAIMEGFGVSAPVAQWLTTGYILVMGIMTAVTAFLFHRFPTRPLVQVSLGLFLLGSVAAYFAPSFPVLLAARLLQAVGAGPTIPLLQIAVLYVYPPERQGFALGLSGIIVGFAPAVGPTLSGVLVDAFGWRGIFVFLMILTLLALLLGWFSLRDVGERKRLSLDLPSILLYSAGFTLVMLAMTFLRSGSFLQGRVIGGFLLGIALLWVFARRQNRLKEPFLRLRLLAGHKSLVYGCVLLSIAYILNMAGTILVPLFNQTLCGYSATASGLLLLPGSLVIALCSPLSGRMTDRWGAKKVCVAGMIANAVGNILFLLFRENAGMLPIAVAYAFRGLGMALVMTPSTSLAVQDIRLAEKSHAMAILNSLRQMSGSLFSAVLVVAASAASLPSETMTLHGMHFAFALMALLSAGGVALSVLVPKKPNGARLRKAAGAATEKGTR